MKRKHINKSDVSLVMKKLQSNFECKICFNHMQNKVFQCKNGHILCESCKIKCTCCPFCKEIVNNRNLVLEQLLDYHFIECPNKGCTYSCKKMNMEEHMKSCCFNPVQCPCCGDKLWKDCIEAHMLDYHTTKICKIEKDTWGRISSSYPHNIKSIDGLSWAPKLIISGESKVIVKLHSTVNNFIIKLFALTKCSLSICANINKYGRTTSSLDNIAPFNEILCLTINKDFCDIRKIDDKFIFTYFLKMRI